MLEKVEEETKIKDEIETKEELLIKDRGPECEPADKTSLIKDSILRYKDAIIDKLGGLISKGRVTINLILFTLLGITVTPFIDAVRGFMSVGTADFTAFFDVIKYIAAPFIMLIATKRIMDDLSKTGETNRYELISCKKELNMCYESMRNDAHKTVLEKERMKSVHDLELQQREGIISLKDYEIDRLNSDITILKNEIHILKDGV